MINAICRYCGDDYPKRRLELGYLSCLECGQKSAEKEKAYKATCIAPAYNKGAYQYITSKEVVVGIFKTGETK